MTAPLGIVAAMHEELSAVLALMPAQHKVVHAGREFWCGQWHDQEVVVVLSRIGKVAAATTAAALIEQFAVSQMIFTGVAGGLGAQVRVGDIVVARELLQHDMDASPLFPKYEIPLTGVTRFPTDPSLSDALSRAARQTVQMLAQDDALRLASGVDLSAAQVHEGLIISGDRFVSQSVESRALQQSLPQALAVEMECAAMAQVCADYGVALAAVRAISDCANDEAHVDFPKFIQWVASRFSASVLDAFLRQ
jgi:adenosylhomocysteine nucleosidase